MRLAELGIDAAIVRDLALKTMFYQGRFTRAGLADALKVAVPVVDEVLHGLSRDGLATVVASDNTSSAAHTYTLTQQGAQRAEEALTRNSYVGPVPVAFSDYVRQVNDQSAAGVELPPEDLARALGTLVLNPQTMRRVGWAAASHKPLLVHGASGNGKTTLARAIGSVLHGTVRIPYAVEIVGQIVRIFDESKHQVAQDGSGNGASDLLRARGDRRWVDVERPVVWAGGELTRHSLELMYDADTRIYEAPLQLKANGGVLIIDDLGRQQIPAIQLLNRWIVALESGTDHLTLHTGQMVEVPFDVVLIFSTNLPPQDLADEAFLRRIRYKVEIQSPSSDEYREIFRRECAARGISYDSDVVDHLLTSWYDGRELRGCHPRDLLEAVVDAGRFDGTQPMRLTREALDDACAAYFL
jgi:predicted ATPase with chaperone activity